jgi:hypothetical protein
MQNQSGAFYSLSQPAIRPIFSTRQPQDSLLKWMGREVDYYSYLKSFWISDILKSNEQTWKTTLQAGVYETAAGVTSVSMNSAMPAPAIAALTAAKKNDGFEVVLYQNIAMGNGMHTNNPWLMELPDPISKVCWDNFASISLESAAELGVEAGNTLKINGIELPVFIQPGQAAGTISIALGYGHTKFGKVASGIGLNVYPLTTFVDGTRQLVYPGAKVENAVVNTNWPVRRRTAVWKDDRLCARPFWAATSKAPIRAMNCMQNMRKSMLPFIKKQFTKATIGRWPSILIPVLVVVPV